MADLKPIPYVQINGVEMGSMATSFTNGDAVVLDGFSITWGRKNQLDTVGPASLSIQVLDKTGAWVMANEQMVGLSVVTGVRFVDDANVSRDFKNFRGKVTDVEIEARDADFSTDNGYMVTIRATDKLAEVANVLMDGSWPAEGYAERRNRIQSATSSIVAGISGAYTAGQLQFAAKTVRGESALDLLAEHMNAGVEWPNYDPDTNRIETVGRVAYEGGSATWTGLKLAETATGSGKYALQSDVSDFYVPFGRMGNNLDAGSLQATSGIRRTIESGITTIRYEYSADSSGSNKGNFYQGTGLNPNIYGQRVFSVVTEMYGINQDVFLNNYAKLAKTAQSWQPPSVVWDTRMENEGFKSFVQVRSMISGRSWPDPLFLSRSRYNAFPKRVPVYFVIGGTMTYKASPSGKVGWIVEPNFGTVEFPVLTWSPLAWNTINPSTTKTISWDQLDDNVTWNDSALTGQGV